MLKVFSMFGLLCMALVSTVQAKDCDKNKSCPTKECAKLVLMDQKGLMEVFKALEETNPLMIISMEKTDFTCAGPDMAIVKRVLKVISPLKIEPVLTGMPLNVFKPLCEKFTMSYVIIKDLNPEFNGFSYKEGPTIDLLEFHLCTGDEK